MDSKFDKSAAHCNPTYCHGYTQSLKRREILNMICVPKDAFFWTLFHIWVAPSLSRSSVSLFSKKPSVPFVDRLKQGATHTQNKCFVLWLNSKFIMNVLKADWRRGSPHPLDTESHIRRTGFAWGWRALIEYRIARTSRLSGCKNDGTNAAEMAVRWQASSRQAVAICAGVLRHRFLQIAATRRLRWSSLLICFLHSVRCHEVPGNGAMDKSSCATSIADDGAMSQPRVERTRSSASCTSLDAQGQCALNSESRLATRARPGDHVSTCLHARTKHASGMAWRSAGESRPLVFPDALVSAVCWPTSEKGELASSPSTFARGFAPGCLHAFSKNLSRREMASVAVLGDDAGWRLMRLPIEERPRVLAPSASAENGRGRPLFFSDPGAASRVNIRRSWRSRRIPLPCSVRLSTIQRMTRETMDSTMSDPGSRQVIR